MEHLFLAHREAMRRLAHALLGDGDDADDVVQDVFARLMDIDLPVADEQAESYLLTAVRNGSLNRIRQKRMQERMASLYPMDDGDSGQTAQELTLRLEEIRRYIDAHVTEPSLTIFRLRFAEGLSFREIAARLDMNINTVYKYFVQSVQKVRQQFNP